MERKEEYTKSQYLNPYERKHPPDKEIMKKLIEDIETEQLKIFEKSKKNKISAFNILPQDLYNDVNQIVDIQKILKKVSDENVKNPKCEATIKDPKKSLNKKTIQEILDRELKFDQFDLRIDPPPEPRRPVGNETNWFAKYIRSTRKDRVQWPSKIYQFDRKFANKTLYEQTDQLMDLAAEDFAEWLSGLGSSNDGVFSKQTIMDLFSIGVGGDTSKALHIEPKMKKAIPYEVAFSLNCPEFSIEKNVDRLTKEDEKNRPKSSRYSAFGRTLPAKMNIIKCSADFVEPRKLDFPEDLRTKRLLFKGITHLKSTKLLVDYIKENRTIPRPIYLVQKGAFTDEGEEKEEDVPATNENVSKRYYENFYE